VSAPYYEDELVTLYHGDCREIDAWLEADVLVTDPPYGRNWRQGKLKSRRTGRPVHESDIGGVGIAGDETTSLRDAILERWGVDRPAVVFGDLMLPPPNGTKLVAVYAKPADSGFRGTVLDVRRDTEAIYLLNALSGVGGRSSIFRTTHTNVGSPGGIVRLSGGHPHAKPLDVMRDLIGLAEGTVADPFAGSGSTLVAAKRMGRKAIGVELEERYCEIAANRLSQGVLDFAGAAPP
jgi:site-specific DNA-methyltransferase (adenine-specific)